MSRLDWVNCASSQNVLVETDQINPVRSLWEYLRNIHPNYEIWKGLNETVMWPRADTNPRDAEGRQNSLPEP